MARPTFYPHNDLGDIGFRRTISDKPHELTHDVGIANLIVWPGVLEQYRRLFLTSGLMGVQGRGIIVHVTAEALIDLTALLRLVGAREDSAKVFLVLVSRSDAARTGGGPDRRELEAAPPPCLHDIFIPDVALGSGIKYRRGVSDDGQKRMSTGAPKIGRFAPITAIPPTRISA